MENMVREKEVGTTSGTSIARSGSIGSVFTDVAGGHRQQTPPVALAATTPKPSYRPTHQRTRSVDLRLLSASPGASDGPGGKLSLTGNGPQTTQYRWLARIEDEIAKLYYKHGLFCSRHPAIMILLSLVVVVLSSYQIITFRMIFGSSYDVYISSSRICDGGGQHYHHDARTIRHNPFMKHLNFWPDSYVRNALDDDQDVPPWFQSNLSYAYVQQIIVRSAVIPWNEEMQLVDSLRGPFDLIFDLVEAISNFQFKNDHGEDITLNDVCFQVFEPTLARQYGHIGAHLPSYSCLTLSPANVWHGDRVRFQQDSVLLTTLLKFQDIPASPVPSGAMHDILFGVQFEDTGIRRTYGRNRMRTITYGVTLILRKQSGQFVTALRNFLRHRYPMSNKMPDQDQDQMMEEEKTTKHVYYHKTFTYNYLVPLTLIYAVVCLYMYFSVRKMEIIRNKRLYSVCTLLTILMSLFLSFGLCFRLKFNSVLIVKRLLPYFVAGISFENMLVLTKSVLAIPHLDSKVRVAQALSKEGLSITKNLLAEMTLLSIGSFTFSPFFQECCKIAAVCFLSDFFIQITFFTPFFSLLIQRISVNERNQYSNVIDKSYPRNIYATGPQSEPIPQKTPKRLRFIYFLARLRLVQRCFILLLSACIGMAIYNAYMVLEQTIPHEPLSEIVYTATPKPDRKTGREGEAITDTILEPTNEATEDVPVRTHREQSFMRMMRTKTNDTHDGTSAAGSMTMNSSYKSPYYHLLYTKDNPMSAAFPHHHWTNLFSLYNISLVGRFISILPPILLSVPVSPERAKQIRNAADSDYHTLKKFIPMKFTNGEYVVSDDDDYDRFEEAARKRFHWSQEDLRHVIGLWIPSFLFFIYFVFQLYRCLCTRNYAEWRSRLSQTNPVARFVAFVKGSTLATNDDSRLGRLFKIDIAMLNYDHDRETYVDANQYWSNNQDIDLVTTNENTCLVATSSVSGDIRVYDSLTCESLAAIKRSQTIRGNFCVYPKVPLPQEFDSEDEDDQDEQIPPNVARTRGELRTLFCGIGNDTDLKETSASASITESERSDVLDFRPIWCMDVYQRYVLVGCGGDDGRFEVWDAYTGLLTFVYHSDSYKNGYEVPEKKSSYAITAMKATYWGVALARMNGQLEMLEVESFDGFGAGFVTPTRKHSTSKCDMLRYRSKFRKQAHQQPIWRLEILDSSGDEEFIQVFGSKGCLISGSKDTTLKVFALDNFKLMYTLNGHCGAIVTTALDPYATASALSGCQLGQLCVWDLNTGTCIFNMQAHSEAEVLSITTSPLYYVSIGTDNIICVWDRYSGNLIHGIPQQRTICRNMVFLEPYILVTVRDGGELTIWDVNDARPICVVPLANTGTDVDTGQDNKWTKSYQMSTVNHLVYSYQRKVLICDYGNSLCIINNPFVEMKKRE